MGLVVPQVIKQSPVIFCDFDGTITIDEVVTEVWREFAPSGWARDVEQMLAGEKSLLEGVPAVFARIPSERAAQIATFAKQTVKFRPGLEELLRYCNSSSIEFIVATGALDFFVEPVLEPYRPLISRVISIPADLSGETIRADTVMACETCALCKAKAMDGFDRAFRITVGDSITDEHGALASDVVFARDRLATIMRDCGRKFHEFDSLLDVRDILRDGYCFTASDRCV